MLSNFQVMMSVWLPDRVTAGFGARVKTRFVRAARRDVGGAGGDRDMRLGERADDAGAAVGERGRAPGDVSHRPGWRRRDRRRERRRVPLTMMCSVLEAFASTMLSP